MINLDIKDKKILYELEKNSRRSLNQISKAVRLKKETLFHRIKRLEQKGIIKKYITEIDIYKIDYNFFPVLIKYHNTTPEVEEEIYNYLEKSKYVSWLTKCDGAWDINLTLIARSHFQLSSFFDGLLSKYAYYISDKQFLITSKIYYYKRGFWINKPTVAVVKSEEESSCKVSEFELKLLGIIANDSRKSLIEISKMMNSTPKTISRTIHKLEKEKIIQGYRILTDFTKMGYKFYKVWLSLNNFGKKEINKIVSFAENHPSIIWTTKLLGYYDFSLEIEAETTEEFRKIISEIKEKFSDNIKKHESLIIFEEKVMNYFPKSH